MNRFILDYDTPLSFETKSYLISRFKWSMASRDGDSLQFCLADILMGVDDDVIDPSDHKLLCDLKEEGVHYIEICS